MKVIPFGDRILVKRRKVGEKAGKEKLIVLPDEIKEAPTDLADVVYIPDNTTGDNMLIDNSKDIIASLTQKATEGDSDALISLLRFNEYMKIKSIKVGDVVFISKYVGTDFHSNEDSTTLTIVKGDDIIGVVKE